MPQVMSVNQNTCRQCGTVMPPASLICPQCGYQHPSPYVVGPASYMPPASNYRPASALSTAVIVLLAISALQHLIEAFIDLRGASLVRSAGGGAGVDQATLESFDMLRGLSALGTFSVLLLTMVVFLCWIHRMHKNLDGLRVGALEFSHGWAVGWWFVPFMNLVRPKQVVDEIWEGSDSPGNSGLVPLWWGSWIVSNLLANGSRSMSVSNDPSTLATGFQIDMFSDFLTVAAAAALIAIVRSIQAGQTEKAARLYRRP